LATAFAGIADLLSKRAVLIAFPPGTRHPLVPGFLSIVVVHNTHGAMGLLGDRPVLLIVLALLVLIALGVLLRDIIRRSVLAQIGFGLVAGGALGNVIDRFVHGYVIDFIAARSFYVFNVGDACITVGIVLVALAGGVLSRAGSG
jgi:signal peptidase II